MKGRRVTSPQCGDAGRREEQGQVKAERGEGSRTREVTGAGVDVGLQTDPSPPRRGVWEPHLWGWQLFRVRGVQCLCYQHVPQDGAKVVGHGSLLLQPTVVLEG